MSERYRILLRADEAESQTLPKAELRDRLRAVPKVAQREDDLYEFGDADEHGIMTVSLRGPAPETLSVIEVEIPRPWVMESGPLVFALVFMMQGWTHWEVYDPQIGDTLQREAVLQGLVAMRQARMQEEGAKVPEPRLQKDGVQTPQPPPDGTPLAPTDETPKKRRWRFW